VLGLIAARASGKAFPDALHERIFAPLGMTRTLAYVRGRSDVTDRAYGHSKEASGFTQADQSSTSATLGDGGVYSCLEDLAKWDEALRTNLILSASELARAREPARLNDGSEPRWPDDGGGDNLFPGRPVAYGFGWFVDPWQGRPRMWHHGETRGFRSVVERFTQEGVTVVLLANRDDLDLRALALKLADAAAASVVLLHEPGSLRHHGGRGRRERGLAAQGRAHGQRRLVSDRDQGGRELSPREAPRHQPAAVRQRGGQHVNHLVRDHPSERDRDSPQLLRRQQADRTRMQCAHGRGDVRHAHPEHARARAASARGAEHQRARRLPGTGVDQNHPDLSAPGDLARRSVAPRHVRAEPGEELGRLLARHELRPRRDPGRVVPDERQRGLDRGLRLRPDRCGHEAQHTRSNTW
jgi:hypothetical protein